MREREKDRGKDGETRRRTESEREREKERGKDGETRRRREREREGGKDGVCRAFQTDRFTLLCLMVSKARLSCHPSLLAPPSDITQVPTAMVISSS